MFVPLASILAIVMPMQALDTLQLRDKAVITGKVLAEKADLLVVDLGYTVINVPRSAVVKVLHGTGVAEPAPTKTMPQTAAALPVAEASKGLYSISSGGLSERSVRELAGQLGEGVVQVRTPSGLGSGFFINEDGHLITNFHVIEGETKISVEVYHVKDGQLERHSYKDVKIIAMNKFGDLSLLKVEDKDAPKFKSVYLGDSDPLVVGDKVFAIGSPQGLERTVTEGILSTKARQFQGALYLQTTTQINPGNSGGPLFNLRGEVVGVTNMKLNFSEGLAFAIPVEQVRWFLDHRDAFAYDTDNPSNAFRYLEPPRHLRDVVVEKP
jgi:serine protease Do